MVLSFELVLFSMLVYLLTSIPRELSHLRTIHQALIATSTP